MGSVCKKIKRNKTITSYTPKQLKRIKNGGREKNIANIKNM